MSELNTTDFPEISFIDNSTIDEVLTAMINDFLDKYEEETGKRISLAKANPYRLIMYACAVQIYQAMQYADYAGKQSFLTYASGDTLDNLAALRGVTRIEATAAVTTIQFSIASPIASAVSIPAGTRVTNGNDVYFATDEYAEIPAGQTSISVTATCTETGAVGNNFAVGELNTVVNTLPYVVSASNIIATGGGADKESDENLKERVYSTPGSYSTAGPAGAYIFHTKSVSSEIGDVAVSSPDACEVVVKFIMADGTLPSAAMIQKVQAYLDNNDIRPLTDQVTVGAPDTEIYNINLTYYIGASDTSAVSTIQDDVAAAVSAYNIWQTEKIGRDINPSFLIKKIMEAGAKRVVITSPVFTAVDESTVAKTGTVTVNYGGVESD